MNNNTFNRKEFIKRLGLSAIAVTAINPIFASFSDDNSLAIAEKDFLREYAGWLKEFQIFVKKRNDNPEDIENNKRLMELSAEADLRKATLENYMKSSNFAQYFNAITEDITNSI